MDFEHFFRTILAVFFYVLHFMCENSHNRKYDIWTQMLLVPGAVLEALRWGPWGLGS